MRKIRGLVGEGRVLADYSHGVIRCWCENPRDGRTMRALRRFFPFAEEYSPSLVRLGGYGKLAGPHSLMGDLADAKMASGSPFVQRLHLFERSDGEGMRTIPAERLV